MSNKPWLRPLLAESPGSVRYHVQRLLASRQWAEVGRGANVVGVVPLRRGFLPGRGKEHLLVCPGIVATNSNHPESCRVDGTISAGGLYHYIDSLAMGLSQAGHTRWRWNLEASMAIYESFYYVPTQEPVVLCVESLDVRCGRTMGEEDGSIGTLSFEGEGVFRAER